VTDDEMICTPGNYVFCKCADSSKGTKLCKPDGRTFEACATKANGECKGGEVQDPNTNKKVDGNGDVIPDPTGDDDTTDTGPGEMDVCPGKPISVPPGQPILLEGDTSRATGDRRGKPGGACAASLGAKDFIYHLIPSGTGSLEVKVQGQGALDPIVYLRSTCDDETTQVACGPQSGTKTATTKLTVITGHDYFLFIDGASGGSGAYSATVTLTTGIVCGDGQVDTGEACDDTNHASGDGCNPDCRGVDGDPTSAGSCPGQTVDLWKGATVKGKGSTAAFGNSLATPNGGGCPPSGTLPPAGTNTGNDHVYKVTPHAAGTMTVTLAAQDSATPLPADLFLSAHDTCSANAPATSCSQGTTAMSLIVEANTPVFIAVDGATTANEKYLITFKLP
jgi:cysteine-rich repeat protein